VKAASDKVVRHSLA